MATPPVSTSSRWFPNLSGRVDPITEQAIRYLFGAVYALQDGHGLGPGAIDKITKIIQPLTIEQTITSVGKALSAGGSSPLNVTGLSGQLASPQVSSVAAVTALPGPGDPLSQVGNTVTFQGVQWQYLASPTVGGAPYWSRTTSIGTTLSDTHANRTNYPAASYAVGTDYAESDRTVTYRVQLVATVPTWIFASGAMHDVLANIPGGLGVNDTGFVFMATDYAHTYIWSGSGWGYSPMDTGSGYTVTVIGGTFLYASSGGWGFEDGSTYAVSKSDGTTVNVVTPVTTNSWLRR